MNPYEYYVGREGDADPIYFRHAIGSGSVEIFTDVGEWHPTVVPLEAIRWSFTPEPGDDVLVSFEAIGPYDLPVGAS